MEALVETTGGIFFFYVIFSSCIFCLTAALFKHSSIHFKHSISIVCPQSSSAETPRVFQPKWFFLMLLSPSERHGGVLWFMPKTQTPKSSTDKLILHLLPQDWVDATCRQCFGTDTKSMLVGTWSRICLTTYYKTVYFFILLFWTSKLQPVQS